MSVRYAPRRSNADGWSVNVLQAILKPNSEEKASEQEDGREVFADQEQNMSLQTQPAAAAVRASFLDTTSLSASSKRSLHSSRLTLSDSKEFFKTIGCRWIRAVRLGDAKMVKKMLEEKPELVHYAPMYGPLALHIATARSDRSIIRLLVSRGADVDARDGAGYTSLQLAIRRSNQSVAHFLISQGANIELIDPEGRRINDYDEWSEQDRVAAEEHVYGKPTLRPKAHSFVGSPSSVSVKSSTSIRPTRPSSTPDNSMSYETDDSDLKRDAKRSSWKSFFDHTPFAKKKQGSKQKL